MIQYSKDRVRHPMATFVVEYRGSRRFLCKESYRYCGNSKDPNRYSVWHKVIKEL